MSKKMTRMTRDDAIKLLEEAYYRIGNLPETDHKSENWRYRSTYADLAKVNRYFLSPKLDEHYPDATEFKRQREWS